MEELASELDSGIWVGVGPENGGKGTVSRGNNVSKNPGVGNLQQGFQHSKRLSLVVAF